MLLAQDFLQDQTIRRMPQTPSAPCVSVILPTFNRCRSGQLARALHSVLEQSFRDFEFIVVDDGSVDGSADLIRQLQNDDARIVHVRHELNAGLPALRVNEGIAIARGQFLAFQFDDDCWQPNALQALVSEIRRHPNPCLVIGKAQFTGADQGQWDLPQGKINRQTLQEKNLFANNSVLFPKEVTHRYGMYDCHIGMLRLCDWDLWLRYIEHIPFFQIDDVISLVFEGNADSIRLTVPRDLELFWYLHAVPRDALLTPANWQTYPVDALTVGTLEFELQYARRLYAQHIVPYYLRFYRHLKPMQYQERLRAVNLKLQELFASTQPNVD
jgi:O-antigen biosynthesis protein